MKLEKTSEELKALGDGVPLDEDEQGSFLITVNTHTLLFSNAKKCAFLYITALHFLLCRKFVSSMMPLKE